MRVLAVEDHLRFARRIMRAFANTELAIDIASTVDDGEHMYATNSYDFILLNMLAPSGEGMDFLRRIRRCNCNIPIIVLSKADTVANRIGALAEGADDCLSAAINPAELIARMRGVLRRPASGLARELRCDGLYFNTADASVRIDGHELVMPRRERAILESLMRANGRVVTRPALEASAYALDDEHGSNVLEANVSRLRRRIRSLGGDVDIKAVRGIGYRLVPADPGRRTQNYHKKEC